jgi:hypothetical protein
MARDRRRIFAGDVRHGDGIRVHGRSEDVKAVRTRSSSGLASVVLVLKAARPVRKRPDEKVTLEAVRNRRGWFW